MRKIIKSSVIFALAFSLSLTPVASACPACAPLPMTLADDLDTAINVVIADKVEGTRNSYKVVNVLKGEVAPGRVVVASGEHEGTQVVLASAGAAHGPFWSGRPHRATPAVLGFTKIFMALPARTRPGAQGVRLRAMLPYLGHAERSLADAAYAEFSVAPWSAVVALAPTVGKPRLVGWLKNKTTPPEHRALYYLFLSRVGDRSDLPWLEVQLAAGRRGSAGPDLAALLVCYLGLTREAGLARVERDFLLGGNWGRQAAALEALRLLVNDAGQLTRTAVLPLFRKQMADRRMAAMVLRDLALWKDWTVLDQAVGIFHKSQEHWVRLAVARYLRSCPLPAARVALQELARKDPKAVKAGDKPF